MYVLATKRVATWVTSSARALLRFQSSWKCLFEDSPCGANRADKSRRDEESTRYLLAHSLRARKQVYACVSHILLRLRYVERRRPGTADHRSNLLGVTRVQEPRGSSYADGTLRASTCEINSATGCRLPRLVSVEFHLVIMPGCPLATLHL